MIQVSFKQHTNAGKPVEPFYELPATAGEVYVPGEALYIGATGTATKCSGTTVPQYICQQDITGVAEGVVLASMVNEEQELETEFSASPASLKVGDKVTIATDGLRVTATTTGGTFTITNILGTATGDAVRGYFMR